MTDRVHEGLEARRRTWRSAPMRLRLPSLPPVMWLPAERVTQQALSLVIFAVLVPILGLGHTAFSPLLWF